MLRITIVMLVLLGVCGIEAEDMNIVKDGQPQAKIMIAEKPARSVQLAVKEFNHYMKKITGTELPVVMDDKDEKGPLILIGESKYTKEMGFKNSDFEKQEYMLKTFPGRLVLMGHDGEEFGPVDYEGSGLWNGWGNDGWYTKPVGTCYAVHDFLSKICGVRWYMPTELGEVVPENKTLSVREIDIRRKPHMQYREHACWSFEMPKKLYMTPDETADKIKKLPLREKNLFS